MRLIRCLFITLLFAAFVWLLTSSARAQIGVSNLVDKTLSYNDRVTFFITNNAAYTYRALLNEQPIPVGTPVTIDKPDFYELFLWRTNILNPTDFATQYVRFIVRASDRVTTEVGLPRHTPLPLVPSSPAEFTDAHLRVLTPSSFPAGYEIPVVAWVVDNDEHAVRANGILAAVGQNPIVIKRGVGSGFLGSNQPPGTLNYTATIGGVSTNKAIELQSGTVWSNVSGTLSGTTVWPAQSRIRVTGHLAVPAGSSLTIGAGTIVLLNAGINITNNGAIAINGTVDEPVVFTPHSRTQPWGGFFMRTSSGSLNAVGTIFVASGADPNGGAGHRPEQCLFLVDNAPTLSFTDSAAIYLAGQMGHAYGGGNFTFTRFLLQRATTGGEYTGASFTVNDSAFIEFPDDTANFVDGDNDALYFVSGSHFFTNTLFGWTKDDGIDSGGSGYGPLTYESCWFEGTFHEGNSLSGYKNTFARNTVYLNCGQGIEDGYDSPTGRLDHCLFIANQAGLRHGDNYSSMSGYRGRLTATNCISIYNHRDIFGFNWDSEGGWTNNYGQILATNNYLTRFDRFFPTNNVWNPAADGWRLGDFGAPGRVGVGFATRGETIAQFNSNGIPVGLSRFCTNEVSVEYEIDGSDGTHLSGALTFPQGEVRQFISAALNTNAIFRVALKSALNADITRGRIYFVPPLASTSIGATTLLASNAVWRYHDKGVDLGAAWRAPEYTDSGWSNGPAQLGFDDFDEATTISRTNSAGVANTTAYFRRTFTVAGIEAFTNLTVRLLRDDGGVVYINGSEVYRSSSLPPSPTPILYSTLANYNLSSAPSDNTIDTFTLPATVLTNGQNTVAVEIHQFSSGSSDMSFQLWIVANPVPTPPQIGYLRIGEDFVLRSTDAQAVIEEASDVTGPWTPLIEPPPSGGPAIAPQKFYRLRR
jgi:hypothetical protein